MNNNKACFIMSALNLVKIFLVNVHIQIEIHTVAVATQTKWNTQVEQLAILLVPKNLPLKGEEKINE
jgi:hypothetical protein